MPTAHMYLGPTEAKCGLSSVKEPYVVMQFKVPGGKVNADQSLTVVLGFPRIGTDF